MTIRFDEDWAGQGEPSARTGFSGNRLTRASEQRDGETLTRALADPAAKYHLFSAGKALVARDKREGASFSREEIARYRPRFEAAVLLGHDAGVPHVAVPGEVGEAALGETLRLHDLRAVLYSSAIGEAEAGALAQAGALLAWHETHRFCGRCGAETAPAHGGYRRDCPSCKAQSFPRTDPVVIMLAIRGERCLLGRGRNFPAGWYSTLAGFVEPGESLENAVRRETLEESGIAIGRVRYHASQPWPFPHSLMIGCFGEALSETIAFDERELEDCRWFSREDVAAMLAGTHASGLAAPPAKAIAHMLMATFAGIASTNQTSSSGSSASRSRNGLAG
jgi:NAD+ diphosphatase